MVAATLLAAAEIATPSYLGHHFAVENVLELSLENAGHLCEIFDTIIDLQEKQNAVEQSLVEKEFDHQQFVIPQTANLRQRSDHAITALWRIHMNLIALAEIFYPKPDAKTKWRDNLEPRIMHNLALDHPLRDILPRLLLTMQTAIAHRNAFTHPDANKGVVLTDYDLSSSMRLELPSIAIKHPKCPIPKMPLLEFFDAQLQSAVSCAEALLFWLCELNATASEIAEHHVEKLAEGETQSGSTLRWQTTFKAGFRWPSAKASI